MYIKCHLYVINKYKIIKLSNLGGALAKFLI